MALTGIEVMDVVRFALPMAASMSTSGSIDPSPRPSPVDFFFVGIVFLRSLFTLLHVVASQNLVGEIEVVDGSRTRSVVHDDRPSVTRRFRQLRIAVNQRVKHHLFEMSAHIIEGESMVFMAGPPFSGSCFSI